MSFATDPLRAFLLCASGFVVVGCALIRRSERLRRYLYLILVLPIFVSFTSGLECQQLALETNLPAESRATLEMWAGMFQGLTLISLTFLAAGIWTARRNRKREAKIIAMAEQAIFSHEQLEMLVSTIHGVLWRRDIHSWNFLSLNSQAEGFLGYSSLDWSSSSEFFRKRIHPEDLPRVLKVWRSLVHGPTRYQVEFRLRTQEDQYVWVCENGASIYDTDSKLTVCGVLKDVDERYAEAAAAAKAHAQQVAAAREAGMAEIAKGVLHNIGNVLNSLNVSAKLHVEDITSSRAVNLGKAARLMSEHKDDFVPFITKNPQGRRLPEYLMSVSDHLAQENSRFYAEAQAMVQHIEHMRDVISLQQVHGRTTAFKEAADLASLMEHALILDGDILLDAEMIIERNFADVPPLYLSKNLLLQILVNLISNARHAVSTPGITERRITLSISPPHEGEITLSVTDTGCGISKANLNRICTHGFTTRQKGNGFGLHHACLLAEEMGGRLSVESDGEGCGASFFVTLPVTLHSPDDCKTPDTTPAEVIQQTSHTL